MGDPHLSPDQRELLDVLEQIEALPSPLVEDDFAPLADRALEILEARGLDLRGAKTIAPHVLMVYEAGFRQDGHEKAADGIKRMIHVYMFGRAV